MEYTVRNFADENALENLKSSDMKFVVGYLNLHQ
jgi:hypothetical protein